jgi:hypothetical protein
VVAATTATQPTDLIFNSAIYSMATIQKMLRNSLTVFRTREMTIVVALTIALVKPIRSEVLRGTLAIILEQIP